MGKEACGSRCREWMGEVSAELCHDGCGKGPKKMDEVEQVGLFGGSQGEPGYSFLPSYGVERRHRPPPKVLLQMHMVLGLHDAVMYKLEYYCYVPSALVI